MPNNENSHTFECAVCKSIITVSLAESYVGAIRLYCHRCKKNMAKAILRSEPPSPSPVTSNNFSTGIGSTTDNIKLSDANRKDTSPSASQISAQLASDPLGLEPAKSPDKVAHYAIKKRIGKGGMGEIYLAEDITSHAEVALKLLSTEMQKSEVAVKRFMQEAKVHRRLDHPNIVKILEFGFCVQAKRLYLAMEYVDGGSLEDVLEQTPVLSPKDSIKIGIAICHALEYALQQNAIHRDLKPANILIDRRSRKIKVGDWGLGKVMDEGGLTGAHTMMGTLFYMPPEQIQDAKNADHRADIYALGATLYHMVTGRPPYSEIKGNSAITLAKLKKDPIPIQEYAKNISSSLANLIHKALARDASQRYSTPNAMLQDLQKALQEQKN